MSLLAQAHRLDAGLKYPRVREAQKGSTRRTRVCRVKGGSGELGFSRSVTAPRDVYRSETA